MAVANRIMKNTGWLYFKMAITMFVSLYTTRLILSSLGVSDFGIYNLVGGVIGMLGFLNSAMASATQRFMNYVEGEGNFNKKKTIFNVSIVLHIVVAIIVVFVLSIAGVILFNGVLNIPNDRIFASIIVYSCLIISTALTITTVPYDAILNSHENMKYYSLIGIFESLLKLAVAFACVYASSDKLILYGILMAIIPFITLSFTRIYCHRKYEECLINPRKFWDSKMAKEITSFAGWGFLSSVAALFTMEGMSILLNMFGGVVVNAAHGIANQLAGQLMAFSNNMLKALNPVLVKSRGAGNTEQMLEISSTGNKLSFLMFSMIAIPFIVEAPYILRLWLKEVPDWAVLFCRLVFIRQMISQTYVTLETCVCATGHVKQFTIIGTILWISPIILGFVLYKFGTPIYTIYILLIILAVLRGLNAMYFCHKECGLNPTSYLHKTVLPCVAQAIILAVPLLLIANIFTESFFRLLLIIMCTIFLYPIQSYFFTFNKTERDLIKRLISSFISKYKNENRHTYNTRR